MFVSGDRLVSWVAGRGSYGNCCNKKDHATEVTKLGVIVVGEVGVCDRDMFGIAMTFVNDEFLKCASNKRIQFYSCRWCEMQLFLKAPS